MYFLAFRGTLYLVWVHCWVIRIFAFQPCYLGLNLTMVRDLIGLRSWYQHVTQSENVQRPYHCMTQALWVNLGRNSEILDGCASTKSWVIMTKGLSMLALLRLLIMPDNALSLPEYTKCHYYRYDSRSDVKPLYINIFGCKFCIIF